MVSTLVGDGCNFRKFRFKVEWPRLKVHDGGESSGCKTICHSSSLFLDCLSSTKKSGSDSVSGKLWTGRSEFPVGILLVCKKSPERKVRKVDSMEEFA